MTAILLRHPAFVPTLEYARDEEARARDYLRHVWETGKPGDPEAERRFLAACDRLDEARKCYHDLVGWPRSV